MAKKIVNNIKLSPTALKRIEDLTKSQQSIMSVQDNISTGAIELGNQHDALHNSIADLVSKSYSSILGVDNLSTSMSEINQILHISQNKKLNMKKALSTKDYKKSLEEFKKQVEGKSQALDLVNDKKNQKSGVYKSYDLILNIIPKMRLAVNTYVTSILSPDDFSKKTIGFKIKTDNNLSVNQIKELEEFVGDIIEEYKLEENIQNDITDYLIKSERAYAILSMNGEILNLLKENSSVNISNFLNTSNILSESVVNNDPIIDNLLTESYSTLFKEDFSNKENYQRSLNEFINESFVFGNSTTLVDDSTTLLENFNTSTLINNALIRNKSINSDTDKVDLDKVSFKTDSVLLKALNPENLVKLDIDGKVLGYLYVDTYEDTSFKIDSPDTNKSSGLTGTSAAGQPLSNAIYSSNDITSNFDNSMTSNTAYNPKIKLISDIFVNSLAAKDNLKLIRQSAELKQSVYYTLLTKKIGKTNKLRVTYLSPDEVSHIERGSSIFDPILFFSKLYIATLLTLLMQNIVRGADSRAYYVDIGLENDAANTINSVIKDIKGKEMSNVHNMDINTMLNNIGSFTDYYIPTIEGERPLQIETVEGLSNISLDNEFLNWLQSNIYSALGIPSAYMNDIDNVDFAKALTQQNSRFVREIVNEQRILGKGYTDLIRKLIIKSNKLKLKIDVNDIEIFFQPPFSLNMQNVTDQVSNLQSLLDSVTDQLPFNPDTKDLIVPKFKFEMFKKYIPNIDWDDLVSIIELLERENIKSPTDQNSSYDEMNKDDSVVNNTNSSSNDSD